MPSWFNAAIGDYHLVDFLGTGGMGEVYRAVHAKVGRTVAIKVLSQVHSNPAAVERFLNEARIQARLQHPNIAALYDFVEFQGQPCIIMEYVDGQTLSQRLHASGELPLTEALPIFQAVVEAICYMHAQQIVHRDIKPANIKVSVAGIVKLLDFGIAKDAFSRNLTTTGSVVGTLRYLSPEQIHGRTADARSDIWALGVLLYEMVTGHLPFDAEASSELLAQISRAKYTPPATAKPALPDGIDAIIARCLQPHPAQRYPAAQALLADVQHLAHVVSMARLEAVSHQRLLPTGGRIITRVRDNWTIALSIMTLVLMLTLGVSVVGNHPSSSFQEPVSKPVPHELPDFNARTYLPPLSAHDRQGSIRIDVLEGSADVYQVGKKVGTTPFQFTGKPGKRIDFTLKRKGSHDLHQTISIPEKHQPFVFQLEKAIQR